MMQKIMFLKKAIKFSFLTPQKINPGRSIIRELLLTLIWKKVLFIQLKVILVLNLEMEMEQQLGRNNIL